VVLHVQANLTDLIEISSVTELAEEVQRLKLRNIQVKFLEKIYWESCICFHEQMKFWLMHENRSSFFILFLGSVLTIL
jgi:uncharacterized protein YdeI (YjbR/CyaY-like superfamily)